jgi:hypothetical protein
MVRMKLNLSKAKPLALAIGLALVSNAAMAYDFTSICNTASFLKALFGGAAVCAIIVLAINSIWGKSELIQHICTGVILAAVIVMAAPALMTQYNTCTSI